MNARIDGLTRNTPSLSAIEGVDFADEVSELTRAHILRQAALITEQVSATTPGPRWNCRKPPW